MLDDYEEFSIGNRYPYDQEKNASEDIVNTSQTSWLDSSEIAKDDEGLYEGLDENDTLIFESKSKTQLYWNGYIKKLNRYTDESKYMKSFKHYNNAYIAFFLWSIGVVLLIFALTELPSLSLFPKSFLRNISFGSSWIYIGFAIYKTN